MATQQDMHIFITGIVGRAMGSGKFEPDDILKLTERAKDAFVAVFGEPQVSAAPPPRVGGAVSMGEGVKEFLRGSATSETTDAGSFDTWKNEKAFYGSKKWEPLWGKAQPDISWNDWYQHGARGDEVALKALHRMAESDPDIGGKWEKANLLKIGRAQTVLAKIKGV